MINQLFLIWVFLNSINSQQYYDSSECSSDTNYPGSRYTCNSYQTSCQTFLIYRSNTKFQNLSDISNLFHINPHELLQWNILESSSQILKPERELLLPINCSCNPTNHFFQANLTYLVTQATTIQEIACGVFEGLTKSLTLFEENPSQKNDVKVGTKLVLPLRCACPDNSSVGNGVKYLITYPFVKGDGIIKLSMKFGIPQEDICVANSLEPNPTVYPNTTILIPLRKNPFINFISTPIDYPPIVPIILHAKRERKTKTKNLYIAGSVLGFLLLLVTMFVCGLYAKKIAIFERKIRKTYSIQTGRSSNNSCLSPDVLVGIKYTLNIYTLDDVRTATRGFNEDMKINDGVYKGIVETSYNNSVLIMIKETKLEDTKKVIDLHAKINHINIVKLIGVCNNYNDELDLSLSISYLVFEFPINGCLRDCLSNPSSVLVWHRRTHIAFDVARGLQYLHHGMFPPYGHMNISCKNIFLTSNWRVKLGNIGPSRGIFASEYLLDGSSIEKVDIFAYGLVLLELISGKEEILKEEI